MIVYDLLCQCGCQFEGWFAGREECEMQQRQGLLVCPVCGGCDIRRILSPVAGRRSGGGQHAAVPSQESELQGAMAALRNLQELIRKNFENVGGRFAETSLRMHYGLEEQRNIRGVATAEEERALASAGVEVVNIPLPLEEEKN